MSNQQLIIISLCDWSGEWAKPYREAGYTVIQVDLKLGQDVRLFEYVDRVHGILAAPPCTAFAGSGAQYWPAKDEDGRTLEGLAIVDACMRIILTCRPKWWALENPVGRLRRWLGQPAFSFNPYEFGDPYTKKTLLWGNFIPPTPATLGENRSVEPVRESSQGSWLMKLGGSSERTKELRSITPAGFARAFFEVNP
jgi:hypothetical protein